MASESSAPEATEPQPVRRPPGQVTIALDRPEGSFELYESAPYDEVFADSATQIMLGPHVSRLLFYRIDGADTNKSPMLEQRRPVISVVLPTAALLQLCGFVATQVSANSAALLATLDAFREQVAATATDAASRIG